MSVPVPDAWTLTSPAHANSRSLPASTCRRRSLCVKCYGVNAPESSFYPMVNANQRVHTQLPCWPERWQLNIWVTPWMGWWFPCHLLEAASRRKHSCLQWDERTCRHTQLPRGTHTALPRGTHSSSEAHTAPQRGPKTRERVLLPLHVIPHLCQFYRHLKWWTSR